MHRAAFPFALLAVAACDHAASKPAPVAAPIVVDAAVAPPIARPAPPVAAAIDAISPEEQAELDALAGKRADVDGELNPEVITLAMIQKLARGEVPLARFVDPSRGVLHVVGDEGPPTEDGKPTFKGEVWCGKQLTAATLRDFINSDRDIYCSNVDGYGCAASSAAEFSMTTRVSFTLDPARGLMLDEISQVSVAMAEAFYAKVDATAAKARAGRKPCKSR